MCVKDFCYTYEELNNTNTKTFTTNFKTFTVYIINLTTHIKVFTTQINTFYIQIISRTVFYISFYHSLIVCILNQERNKTIIT